MRRLLRAIWPSVVLFGTVLVVFALSALVASAVADPGTRAWDASARTVMILLVVLSTPGVAHAAVWEPFEGD